ncbi:MAG: Beta-glucanase precursor [Bacteroidota bacterium]|jgi:beta-glucanase (GH16 family)
MRFSNYKKISQVLLLTGITTAAAIALNGCKKEAVQTLPERKWSLVWSDDFTGTAGSAPDNTKWAFDLGGGGWGNNELQVYTNNANNVKLDGAGKLVITAISNPAGFTSARLKTKGKFAQAYGRFEARIKTPTGPGIWPAFWMLGSNIDSKPWPQCGEIDIMEQRGQQPTINYGTIHGPGYAGGNAIGKSYALMNGRFDTDFHIYAVEWGKDYIDFFVDNFLYHRITPEKVTGEWVYNQPFFLLLNVAVGGNFVGFPTTGTPFPQSMYVDYVKVYKQL